MEENIQNVINSAIDRLNELLPAGDLLSKDPATVLLGKAGRLDSMGFVNLIVALEEELDLQLGCTIVLADELASREEISTVADLHQFLVGVVQTHSSAKGWKSDGGGNE